MLLRAYCAHCDDLRARSPLTISGVYTGHAPHIAHTLRTSVHKCSHTMFTYETMVGRTNARIILRTMGTTDITIVNRRYNHAPPRSAESAYLATQLSESLDNVPSVSNDVDGFNAMARRTVASLSPASLSSVLFIV